MRKILIFTAIVMMALASASCGCYRGGSEPQPEDTTSCGYDYDSVVAADYDYIASQYQAFRFLEADVVFDTLLDAGTDARIISIGTVFQAGDTCIMIFHNPGKCGEEPEIVKENDHWMECMDMSARNPISFDSCMSMVEPYMCNLPTRKMTFRRRVGPPFPKHGEYIFGNGYLFVESHTGEINTNVPECGE